MTDYEINLAIAQSCGWRVLQEDKWLVSPPNSPYSVQPLNTIPDYCNDLNAMHEAEMSMIIESRYWANLIEVVVGFDADDFDPDNEYSCLEVVTASARQRAEAFLKTIDKWDETSALSSGGKA